MKQEYKDRLAALMGRASDRNLAAALRTLNLLRPADLTPDHRMTRAWIIDELERRHPAASDAVQAAFDAAEALDPPGDVDYVAVLLSHIPA